MGRDLYRCNENLSGSQYLDIFVLKVEFNCFLQVLDGFFNCFASACNIKLRTPGNIPFSFLLYYS
jgi:hypothetical protein